MKQEDFSLHFTKGNRPVKGYRCGKLFVHKHYGDWEACHIVTGFAAHPTNVRFTTRQEALEYAQALQDADALHGWGFCDFESVEHAQAWLRSPEHVEIRKTVLQFATEYKAQH